MSALILASQSPRRQQLLADLGVEFEVLAADIDETVLPHELPQQYVERLAIAKAQAVLARCDSDQSWVLGSDTTVIIDDQILGKPVNQEDFLRMMRLLSGRSHQVLTSIALLSKNQILHDCVTTEVRFCDLDEAQMLAYWRSGEPEDKAGGYGIQGLASIFIEQITGSYSAVMGLPMHQTAKLLAQANIPLWHGDLQLI